jgi:4-hydroxythreonine-4-phosphate dehydrogenase
VKTESSSSLPRGSSNLPVIAITMGDPAGIGPEVVAKTLSHAEIFQYCRPLILGDKRLLKQYIKAAPADPSVDLGELVVDFANVPNSVTAGIESAESGKASATYIEAAVDMWRRGEIDAIATAPISKKALSMAGYDFPGHTEFLASLTNTPRVAMSFFAEDLRVVLLSTHLALREAIDLVTTEKLSSLIRFADKQLGDLLGRKISIAVAGLNPHASEGGMFGSEEADAMMPSIKECAVEGINVTGPYSPDTVFLRGFRGEFDAVIACYHDQATIAVKSLSFGSSVNVTLGLPLIRTSVDHGTAFDIAGKNRAEESSMVAAIRLAAELANLRADAAAGSGHGESS